MTRNDLVAAALAILALAGAGCRGGEAPPPAAENAGGNPHAGTAMDPHGGMGMPPGHAMPARMLDLGNLVCRIPEAWVPEVPESRMRAGQARIPGPGGDALLVVFWFGPGQGGGVEANLQRWISQVDPEPGVEPRREDFPVGPYRVHVVEVAGAYRAAREEGGPGRPVAQAALLGAVVEGDGGPWFFKVTGPRATVEANRGTFLEMLRALRPAADGLPQDAPATTAPGGQA